MEQSGSITGIVTDGSGAAISAAKVSALNIQTGVLREETSNGEGIYSIGKLLPQGVYTVKVSAPSFSQVEKSQVRLDQSQVLRLDFTLAVGGELTTVEVTSQAVALDVETTLLSTTIERSTTVDLPLNGRNDNALITLVPSVRTFGSFGGFQPSANSDGRVQIGGGNPSSNNFEIDGTANENQDQRRPGNGPITRRNRRSSDYYAQCERRVWQVQWRIRQLHQQERHQRISRRRVGVCPEQHIGRQ